MLPLHNPFGRQLLTMSEAAFATGVTRGTVHHWVRCGYIKRYGTRHLARYNWDEIAELMTNPPKLPPARKGGRPKVNRVGLEDRQKLSLLDAAIAGLKAQVRSGNAPTLKPETGVTGTVTQ